jgi:uncharacterized protein (DUF1499 family)
VYQNGRQWPRRRSRAPADLVGPDGSRGRAIYFAALARVSYCRFLILAKSGPAGTIRDSEKNMKQFNKIYTGLIVGIILLAMSPMMLGLIWPKINDIRTSETPEYPDLQVQRFAGRQKVEVFNAVLDVAQEMEWEIREANADLGLVEAVATVPVFRFRDDVTVTLSEADRVIEVHVRSRSRVGKSDLGENARRIRKFQGRLSARLAGQ